MTLQEIDNALAQIQQALKNEPPRLTIALDILKRTREDVRKLSRQFRESLDNMEKTLDEWKVR